MNRRDFLSSCLATAGLVRATPQHSCKPNILLIVIDDLGWSDVGCQGSTFYETPAIDRLAREGARFTNAYANCPVCSPSRAALMTGRYPARVRFTGHITASGSHRYPPNGRIIPPNDRLYLRSEEVTLAEALRPAEYTSASIGKWHLGSQAYWPEKQGFDVNLGGYDHGSPPSHFYPYRNPKSSWNPEIPTLKGGSEGEYLTDRLTDEAIRFIERNRNRPWFCYLTHYAVHTPLQAPEPLVQKYREKQRRDDSQKSAVYAAMVESVDQGIGRLTSTLERLRLVQNTLVIVTSDNGGEPRATSNAPLRAGKGTLYEGGIRVPLIVRWPGRVRAGAVSHTPVMGADLYPTILDFALVSRPPVTLDGISLRAGLEREDHPDSARDVYWYYPHYSPQYQQPGAAIRSGRFKLIEFYDPPNVELYDLESDIGERNDLARKLPGKRTGLETKLHSWLISIGAILHRSNPNFHRQVEPSLRP